MKLPVFPRLQRFPGPGLLVLLGLVASGCTVGPNYQSPETSTPKTFRHLQTTSTVVSLIEDTQESERPESGERWWTFFEDPQLNHLVEDALQRNLDLEAAKARIRASRAAVRIAGAAGRPQLQAGFTGQRLGFSENAPEAVSRLSGLGLSDSETDLFELGFDAGWEIDLFGAIRRSFEAASTRYDMAIESAHQVRLSITAEVVRAYSDLRWNQRRLALAEKNARLQKQTLTLVTNKHSTGLVSSLDVQRTKSQWLTTLSLIPPLRGTITATAHRLSVLTGRPPAELLEKLSQTGSPLALPPTIPVGLPSELLRSRPDIRHAERHLAAATADIGIAVADLYPRVFLSGSMGRRTISSGSLLEAASGQWSIGPTIRWPIFQAGRLRAKVEAAESQRDAIYAEYRQTVLLALEEVETLLVELNEEGQRQESLRQAVVASEKARHLAVVRYERGLSDLLSVLDAERSQTELEDRLAVSEMDLTRHAVALYKGLGGGHWPVVFGKNDPLTRTSQN